MKINPSIVVNSQAPEFIRSDYAKFITFLQKYYEFLEQNGNALDVIRNLESYNDIDYQDDANILSIFYTLFLPDFPQVLKADKKFILKNIVDLYNSKGSIDSIKAFFRILYGDEVEVFLPKTDILKLDAGVWRKVFKIKVADLSEGTLEDLLGSVVYQLDPINGNRTVQARVVDFDPTTSTVFLTADNIILNFKTVDVVYATNKNGILVMMHLDSQLTSATIQYSGLNYQAGNTVTIDPDVATTEKIVVESSKSGFVSNIKLLSGGSDYSTLDKILFSSDDLSSVPAEAKIVRTINDDLVDDIEGLTIGEPEDKLTLEDNTELRQEMGIFVGKELSNETDKNINSGSITSADFGVTLEDQENDVKMYSRASYTYNQGLFRPILPRVGATSNYSINWATNESLSVTLNDEELWIGVTNCDEGVPSNPGTIIIQFEDQIDYTNLVRYELTSRSVDASIAPEVDCLCSPLTNQTILDSKIGGLSEHNQIGVYGFGQQTLSALYPFSETPFDPNKPTIYIRERNTLCGHDLTTSRPWEYRFIFKKGSVVKAKIYVMPVQYDIRSSQILAEDGSEIINELDSSETYLQESPENTYKRRGFDPGVDVSANTIHIPGHEYLQGEVLRYNTFTDIDAGIVSDVVGGISDNQIFYCNVVDQDNIQLVPFGSTSEGINNGIVATLTPAATTGTTNYLVSFVGGHVTNGSDYTSTDVEDSAISIYARKRSIGTRDLAADWNIDPMTPVDSDTGVRVTYPYTVDKKVYLFQALNESTEYIKMERDQVSNNESIAIALEIDPRSVEEQEQYATYPYIALENSIEEQIQNINEIEIPDAGSVRVSVERKSIQMVDDINRGTNRLNKVWNDYAEIGVYQELFETAKPTFSDEYSTDYLNAVLPTNSSDYSSGPAEFANVGANMFVASSKNNSVVYGDGSASGNFKYPIDLPEQRRITFVETQYYDGLSTAITADNGPLGYSVISAGYYNTHKKKYFTIGFSMPKELNQSFDVPFEVNLKNIIDSIPNTTTYVQKDLNDYFTLEGSLFNNESLFLNEDGSYIATEIDAAGYSSRAGGNMAAMSPTIVLEFFSPSLPESNPKKHLVYYCNRADYTTVSTDAQRTIYQFYNAWSPNRISAPDTSVTDYTVSVRSLVKSDYVIEKLSDTQLLATNPDTSSNGSYHSPFYRDLYVKKGVNSYGKYITLHATEADAIAGTNPLMPFSYGTEFGSQIAGNELFYNPFSSGTTVNATYNNPISTGLMGVVKDNNVSLARYFDPSINTGVSITIPKHGFVDGTWVRFRADFNGSAPNELTDNATYYVKVVDSNTIKLASSKANYSSNTFITLTYSGSTATCALQTVPQSLSFNSIKDLSFDTRALDEDGNMAPLSGNQRMYGGAFLNAGDQVVLGSQRKLDASLSNGSTAYVLKTSGDDNFTLTNSPSLTAMKFGTVSVPSSSIDTSANTITSANHGFYNGEELLYTTTGTSLGIPSTVYAIRISSSVFQVAATRGGDAIDLSTAGSGYHEFIRSNETTLSELAEVVPYSAAPNSSAYLNPGVTGTGIEEFTIAYMPSLTTETGTIDQIQMVRGGSYRKIPSVQIVTADGRTGSGADFYPEANGIGAIKTFEFLDGGRQYTDITLYPAYSFLCETITGADFQVGEPVYVSGDEIGTIEEVNGHYFKVKSNGSGYVLQVGDTVYSQWTDASAVVTTDFTATATAHPGSITESTESGSTQNYNGDKNLLNTTTKLQDSYYYQDYSYVIKGANSYEDWKPYFNKLVHPAGMAVFGEVDYFTTSSAAEKLGNTEVSGQAINNTNTAITTEMTTS
jgi:hypothetical protein